MWLCYAGEVEARYALEPARGSARVPARSAGFRNLLLVEQPNGSYADPSRGNSCSTRGTCCCCAQLAQSSDARIAGIAAKAVEGGRLPRRAFDELGVFASATATDLSHGTDAGGDRCAVDVHRR
jgi:hypothetical protein